MHRRVKRIMIFMLLWMLNPVQILYKILLQAVLFSMCRKMMYR